jgi:protein SCO1
MKNIKKLLNIFCLLIFSYMPAMATELPDESIYHIGSDWINHDNENVNITSLQGKVQVVAFVYTYCEHSCPVILSKLKYIENNISPEDKDKINLLLISLDPKRDTPEVLKQYMKEKELDENYWKMFSGDPDDVLELSALVGVRYKPMNNTAKDIAHSNMITILDKKGRLYYQMKGLDASLEKVLTEIGHAAQI